ncbi:MAG: hypothetical protein AAF468_04810 [Pseudomonadota bacterium]
MSRSVHLVGSVPLADTDAVFTTCCEVLGDNLKRVPDGETGERTNWIAWQRPLLGSHEALEIAGSMQNAEVAMPRLRVRDDFEGPLEFHNLGYRDAALQSFERFRALKADGKIGAQRFQVSLPTPLAIVAAYVEPEHQSRVFAPYHARLLEELVEIRETIPASDLAIQWDVAIEFAVLEGLFPVWFDNPFDVIADQLSELGDAVPDDVEMGFHFCYGDAGNKHFKEPDDMALLAKLGTAVSERTSRFIDWIHMPVPIERDDETYFRPLSEIKLKPGCELFLGLIHEQDGIEGTTKRIETAKKFRPEFGIATECGLGRRDPTIIPDLLKLHTDLSNLS